ncbi:hypothetical protein ACWD4J_22750 [Streptomyces sp. NPDC002577]
MTSHQQQSRTAEPYDQKPYGHVAAIMRAAPLAAALCTPPPRDGHGGPAAVAATARSAFRASDEPEPAKSS